MTISVVIPAWGTYSVALPRAIESVLAQDHECELIVVDNASDPPLPGCDGVRLLRLDERVTLGAARNAGLSRVTTPYVVFWDADDRMLPGALTAMRDGLEGEPPALACACELVDGQTHRRHHFPRRWVDRLAQRPPLFAWVNTVWSLFPVTGTLLRTETVRAVAGFPDADSGDDWALAAALAYRGRVRIVRHPGRWYEQSPDSLSARWRAYPHIFQNARLVRSHLRSGCDVPAWARASLPVVAALQLAIMTAIRPPARLIRRRKSLHRRDADAAARPAAARPSQPTP